MKAFSSSYKLIASLAVLFALVFSSNVSAANTGWATQRGWQYSSATKANLVATAYLNEKACNGTGRVYVRTRTTTGGWTRPKALSGCQSSRRTGRPTVSIDSKTNAVVVTWHQVSVIQKLRPKNGIYMRVGYRGGKSWQKNSKMLARTPSALGVVDSTSAAQRGVVWVANTEKLPSSMARTQFSVTGYNLKSGKRVSKNIALRRGSYNVDYKSTVFRLHNSGANIFVTWDVSDSGGSTQTFVASARLKSASRAGSLSAPAKVLSDRPVAVQTVSPAGDLYLGFENANAYAGTNNYSVFRFSPGTTSLEQVATLYSGVNLTSPLQLIGLAVSGPDLYVAYETWHSDNSDGKVCFEVLVSHACVRNIAPTTLQAAFSIRKYNMDTKQETESDPIGWPFTASMPAGDTILEFRVPRSGADILNISGNNLSLNVQQGFEDLSSQGTIGVAPRFRVVVHTTTADSFVKPPDYSGVNQ